MKYWTIAPLLLGTLVRDKSFLMYFRQPGIKINIGILAYLLACGEEKVVVDTGPSPLALTAGIHLPYFQTPEQSFAAQLKRFHTRLEDVKMVINTHLHWDHCYQNLLFKNARFFVQKRELDYAQHPLPAQKGSYDVGLEGVTPPFEKIIFEVIDGDLELAPGIKVILSPGHSPGMQTVCVQTSQGPYIIAGDNLPLFENMSVQGEFPYWPNGLYVDLKEYYESLQKIGKMNGHILPGHDLKVMERETYP